MSDQNDSRFLRFLQAVSAGAAAFVFALGSLVLVGWVFDLALLKAFSSDLIAMKANTALAFALTGLSLWLLQPCRAFRRAPRIIGRVCALLVVAVGLFTLFEYAAGRDLGIDQLLFSEPSGAAHTIHPGRMAPNTALLSLLMGLALLLLDVKSRSGRRPALYLIALLGLIALLALSGYLSDASTLYTPTQTANPMSLPAALAGVVAFVGLSFARPTSKLPRFMTRENVGFVLALVILVVVAGLSYRNMKAMVVSDAWENHTYLVTQEFDRLLGGLDEQQSAYRGFVITGREDLLESYGAASALVDEKLASLKRLTQDNPRQQKRLDDLEVLAKKQLAFGERVIALRQTDGFDAASQLILTGQGKATMDDIRLRVREATQAEEVMLLKRAEAKDAETRRAIQIIFVGSLLSFLLLGAVFILLKSEIARRSAAEEELYSQAALLDLAHDAIIVLGMDRRVVFWSQGAQETYGWAAEEVVGRVIDELLRTRFPVPLDQIIHITINKGQWAGELNHARKDGSHIVVASRWALRRDRDGRPSGVMEINRDITLQKQMEQTLRDNEARYRSLVTATSQIIWTTDPTGYVVEDMPTWRAYTGLTLDQIKGWGWLASLHPDDTERTRAAWMQAVKNRSLYEIEYRIRRHDGVYRQFSVRGVPITNDGGSVREWIGACTDVTDRKLAEDAVRTASLYARSLLEASLDPLVTISPDGKITDVNRATELATGVSRSQLVGRDFSDYFTEPDKAREGYQKVISEGEVWDYPLTIRHTSGSTMDVLYNASVYRDEAGEVQGVFAAARDITERKRAEAELAQYRQHLEDMVKQRTAELQTANEKLQVEMAERERTSEALRIAKEEWEATFDAVPDLIAILDNTHHIIRANRAMAQRLGATPEECIGLACYKVVHAMGQPPSFCPHSQTISDGQEHHAEVSEPRLGGDFLVSTTPVLDAQGRMIGTVHVARDITERKKAEQALLQASKELARTNENLKEFAYVASHDLQEPLRMVSSYLQLLEHRYKDKLGAEANDFIHYAVDGATRMQQLINDLLAYSRAGRAEKNFAPTDMNVALDRALANLGPTLREAQASVTHDTLPTLQGDATQLVQLLQNLIGNAVKFHGDKLPLIHIGARQTKAGWQFSVADNGIGIEKQYFNRIFLVFQRLHGREQYAGTGIGLAICKKIIERHGGNIWVESEPGKGSTFYFTVPD